MEQSFFYLKLKEFLKSRNPDLQKVEFDENTHLIRAGIIDSFAVTELILFIEHITKTKVRIEELTAENIKSLSAIYSFFVECDQKSLQPGKLK